MHPRTLPALLLALVLPSLLAGCAEEAPAPAALPEDTVVVTSADDLESLENQTLTQENHLHDYWDGNERLLVMHESKEGSTFFLSDEWASVFEPPAGSVVPQGTSHVEVTLSWTDSDGDTYSEPELWAKSPAASEPTLVGPLASGETLVIPTTLKDADLPHQALSAWQFEFRLHPGTPAGLIWFRGTIDIHVEAVRGLEIPLYPPHADLWGGKETIDLLHGSVGFEAWRGDAGGGYNCYGGCPIEHQPGDGVTVPYDAALVEVVLEMGSDSLTRLGLSYHGADSREWTRVEPSETDGTRSVYRIPLTPGMGDGPYAAQSQWRFLPYALEPEEDGLHAGSYTLTARTLRNA